MTRVTVTRTIQAPVARVFSAIADISDLPATNPDVVKVEFLTERHDGVGTRFRETRLMNGRENHTELEITELVADSHARMVADSHGTIWDTTFTVRPAGQATELEIRMDARPHTLMTRIMTPLFKGMFRKGIEKHIDAVRAYCEQPGG